MKHILFTALSACFALTLRADPKSDLQAAARKLSEAPNYTWTAKLEVESSGFTPDPFTGMAERGGFAVLTIKRNGNVTTAVQKDNQGVVKTDDGWKTVDELGQGVRGQLQGTGLLRGRRPDVEIASLGENVSELKIANGVISGELTEESAKELMFFGRGWLYGQRGGPKITKGSVKVWLKNGLVSKMEVKTSVKFNFNGIEKDVASTRTVEIKDVGKTKFKVPDEAVKKLEEDAKH